MRGGSDHPLRIHFLHVRSPEANAFPLVLTHGWPGSIVEFVNVLGPLADPAAHGGDAADAFHVVCPSLPGFGFSDKPTGLGWDVHRIAAAWDELMVRLGYERYGAQGGDWGSLVTTLIGVQNLGHCAGIHLNSLPRMAGPGPDEMADLTPAELTAVERFSHFQGRRHRLLASAEHPATDARLRARRLSRRPGGVDPREVLRMDRQRRAIG